MIREWNKVVDPQSQGRQNLGTDRFADRVPGNQTALLCWLIFSGEDIPSGESKEVLPGGSVFEKLPVNAGDEG